MHVKKNSKIITTFSIDCTLRKVLWSISNLKKDLARGLNMDKLKLQLVSDWQFQIYYWKTDAKGAPPQPYTVLYSKLWVLNMFAICIRHYTVHQLKKKLWSELTKMQLWLSYIQYIMMEGVISRQGTHTSHSVHYALYQNINGCKIFGLYNPDYKKL